MFYGLIPELRYKTMKVLNGMFTLCFLCLVLLATTEETHTDRFHEKGKLIRAPRSRPLLRKDGWSKVKVPKWKPKVPKWKPKVPKVAKVPKWMPQVPKMKPKLPKWLEEAAKKAAEDNKVAEQAAAAAKKL